LLFAVLWVRVWCNKSEKYMVKHINITVRGRVQGVWYRASAEQKARQLGLTGFVRNLANGEVYLEAEGEESALSALVSWCHQGPLLARVDGVKVEEGEMRGFAAFEQQR
jgi:acylphosphatase